MTLTLHRGFPGTVGVLSTATDPNGSTEQALIPASIIVDSSGAPVSLAGGDASAANQTTQITAANLTNTTLGAVTASPAANTISDRLKALLTGTILAASSAIIGKVGIDQTTPGTTNGVQVNAALPVGANLIGKVGVDQTTPGTTDLVTARYSRPVFKSGTFTPATSYANTQVIGGLLTISGLTAGRTYGIAGMSVFLTATTITAQGNLGIFLFSANPTTSTITDGTIIAISAADLPKVSRTAVAALGGFANFGFYQVIANGVGNGLSVTADGSGQIYLAFIASGTFTLVSPSAAYLLELHE